MPILSRFYGIAIAMYWRDHAPPHFHAKYGEQEVIVEIDTGKVTGSMKNRALSMVKEWLELRREELKDDWQLAEQNKQLKKIDPLE